ncbi:MAG: hypothetical protein Q8O00_11040 [Holophaga sp.]|nr:hypothetical protein [Holophaga sp.]
MAANAKNKEIQVQKPAQSLQAFQRKLDADVNPQPGLLKPLLIGAGVALVLAIAFFGIRSYRANALEKHEGAVAQLLLDTHGDGITPLPAAEQEKKMREKLSQLEALAKKAPSPAKTTTEGLLASWKLQLDGKGSAVAQGSDPWSMLRMAQQELALGQAEKVASLLAPLRKSAKPDAPWAPLFWATLLDLHRLKGDRDQAWKDYADYKGMFKDRADGSFDKVMASI